MQKEVTRKIKRIKKLTDHEVFQVTNLKLAIRRCYDLIEKYKTQLGNLVYEEVEITYMTEVYTTGERQLSNRFDCTRTQG